MIAVYLYLLILLSFFFALEDVIGSKNLPTFYDIFTRAADRPRKIMLAVLFATFLGTPVTLGFFYKTNVFNAVAAQQAAIPALCIIVNLVLTVFYLQSLRTNQIARKKHITAGSGSTTSEAKAAAAFGVFVSLVSFAVAPALNDLFFGLAG